MQITFTSRKENIRKADDIQRRSRQVFPILSTTYIDKFYKIVDKKNQEKADNNKNSLVNSIIKNLSAKIKQMRSDSHDYFHYSMFLSSPNSRFEYMLKCLKKIKAGNCNECSVAVLGLLAANGYTDSTRVSLGYENKFINKETGTVDYYDVDSLDHAVVLSSMGKKNHKKKDLVIIDSWLGFADSVSGSISRFKQLYSQEKLDSLSDKHKEIFSKQYFTKNRQEIDFSKYEHRKNFVFYYPTDHDLENTKYFGNHVRTFYPESII